jgi:hypothetical protein
LFCVLGVFWFLKFAAWVERKESSLVECLFVCFVFWNYKI